MEMGMHCRHGMPHSAMECDWANKSNGLSYPMRIYARFRALLARTRHERLDRRVGGCVPSLKPLLIRLTERPHT